MNDQLSFEDDTELHQLQRAWKAVLKRVVAEVPAAWYERFLKPLKPVDYANGKVVLVAPGKFVQEWVKERFFTQLVDKLTEELGRKIELEIRAEPRERTPQLTATTATVAAPAPPENPSFRPNERYTFESFIIGASNRLAVAGAKAVAQDSGGRYNPLFIYGESGLGKTHLLHAIANEVLKRDPSATIVYVTAQQFAEEYVSALQNNRIEHFRRAQRNVSIWLLDDVQLIAGKEKTQEEIFHTFNVLHSFQKQIVLTSDRPPRDLHIYEERLRTRFESGLVADVKMPDTETRCAIIQSKAAAERIELPHEVAMYLAMHVPGSIRVLEGALTKLAVEASLDNAPITPAIATQMVEQYYRPGTLSKPSFSTILDVVGRHYNIETNEIKGVSRRAPIVHARHIAIYITRRITGDSWNHIGSMFGDRDHTSMMHAFQKISEMMEADKDLKSTIGMLMRTLYPEAL
jgi:chromosomal replication initiator protein